MREATLLKQQVRVASVVTLVQMGSVAAADYVVTRQIMATARWTRWAQWAMFAQRCWLGRQLQLQVRDSGLLVARCMVQVVQP